MSAIGRTTRYGDVALHVEQQGEDRRHRADGRGGEVDDAVRAVDEDDAHRDQPVERTERDPVDQVVERQVEDELDDDEERDGAADEPADAGRARLARDDVDDWRRPAGEARAVAQPFSPIVDRKMALLVRAGRSRSGPRRRDVAVARRTPSAEVDAITDLDVRALVAVVGRGLVAVPVDEACVLGPVAAPVREREEDRLPTPTLPSDGACAPPSCPE